MVELPVAMPSMEPLACVQFSALHLHSNRNKDEIRYQSWEVVRGCYGVSYLEQS